MSEDEAIVISEHCPHCRSLKRLLEKRGLLDKIKVINVDDKEGLKFAKQNNITAVPECVIMLDKDGKKTRVSSEDEFQKLIDEGK